jgi:uncharacterized membrane protein
MTIAALALAGIFLALYLTLYKLGYIGHLACGLGSCERVNTSRWATFLGLPVAAWGVGFYVVTFAVALWGTSATWAERREPSVVLVFLTTVGLVFSAWLTYLELYVIGAVCRFCVGSAALVTLLFLLSIIDLRASRPTA